MHYHLTEPQIFAAGFTLLIGIIFALAAVLQLRAEKHPPFSGFFCAGLDRNMFAKFDFSQPEIPRADRNKVFADIDDCYLDPSPDQNETHEAMQARLD
jgi:hypothetical protein